MSENINSINFHVGQRLRQCRLELGVSQQDLGKAINLSYQQIQRYEAGENHIGATYLWKITKALNTPFQYFFEGVAEQKDNTNSIVSNNMASSFSSLNCKKHSDSDFIQRYLRLPTPLRIRARQLIIAVCDAYGVQCEGGVNIADDCPRP